MAFIRQLLARYPPGTGSASIRRSMLANSRRVRWLSASNSHRQRTRRTYRPTARA